MTAFAISLQNYKGKCIPSKCCKDNKSLMITFAFTLQILKFKDLLYNRAGKISKDERLLFPSIY